jgi:hypothetical protein
MIRLSIALVLAAAAVSFAGSAAAADITGRFIYEDRLYDGNGYAAAVQQLPVRRCLVEIVDGTTTLTLGTGFTDGDGNFSVTLTTAPAQVFARVITDGRPAGYEIRVVDNFVRDIVNAQLILVASQFYSANSDTVGPNLPGDNVDLGTNLIQDDSMGLGPAQAFNIFDNAVDFFDWMAQPGILGRLPNASEHVVYGWATISPNGGSNYSLQGIYIGSTPNEDTDGWADTVILHETGHWFDDVFSRSDNPGGAHFIGDNNANVLLAYGEGAATFHCAKVREWRATTRLNLASQPVDNLVSLYADLLLPPAVGVTGALSFSYDFETGLFANSGAPIGQRGSANETNVTSALWELLDGPSTPDASPGVDDDIVEVGDDVAWTIERTYLPSLAPGNAVTVEDYYQGWFATQGAGFMQAGMDQIFVTLALMPFIADVAEPDNATGTAKPIVPLAHGIATGHVVISEIDLGPQDAVELYNSTAAPVDLTGWQIEVYVNGVTNDPTRIYTFAGFTLQPGEVVAVHERGDVLDNGKYHLYAGDNAAAFNASWANGGDGAVVLRDAGTNAVDFVKWKADNGTPNSTPVPPGVSFTGLLDSPAAPNTLGRDVNGTDTDTAADFVSHYGSLGSGNHPSPQAHTIFGIGDMDVVSFNAVGGTRYGFEARGPYSASDPLIELLSPAGLVLGSNNNMDPAVRDARIDFYAPTNGKYYVRVTHAGALTDWAEYQLLAFERPLNNVFAGPASISATAGNFTDTGDEVLIQWLNASAYDSVHVYRDSTLIASVAGSQSRFTDFADRGLYRYEVSGLIAGQETPRVATNEFAGFVTCFAADDFESGSAAQWITAGSSWDVFPGNAASGTFSFTDSPAGTYSGCPTGSACTVNAIATFGVPFDLPAGSTLEFDHICITEDDFDFGILEVSTNDGGSWIELQRWDQGDYPEWGDNVADPTDWKHESIDLSAFTGMRKVLLRFRLASDQLLELDGWYVDNVQVNDSGCTPVVGVESLRVASLKFLAPYPNPARAQARLSFVLPVAQERVELMLYDVSGRLVRAERMGAMQAGLHTWVWDGKDRIGGRVASGVYFARLSAGGETRTQKLLRLAP